MQLVKTGLVMLLIIILGHPVGGAAADNKSGPGKNAPAMSAPQKVVHDYYAAYIAWLKYDFKTGHNKVKSVRLVPNRSLDPALVTQHFIDSYQALMQENEKTTPKGEVGLLDYDPILCAQDYPDSMEHASLKVSSRTDTDASVKVDLAGQKSEPPVMVKLKKQGEGWRIDAIFCGGDDFDAMYQKIKQEAAQQKK